MGKKHKSKFFFGKFVVLAVVLFFAFVFPLKNIYAETADVSTASQLLSHFNSGGDVRLVENITLPENAFVGSDLVLDLNGHTLNLSNYTLVPYEATLTVKDDSVFQTGRITSTNDFTIIVGGSDAIGGFILDSGNVDCKGQYCIYNYGELTVNGGSVSADTFTIYNMKDFTMNGGSVTSKDVAVGNYAEGANFTLNGGTVETTSVSYVAVTMARPNTSFVMNGGVINAVQHKEDNTDGGSAVAAFKDTEVTINGGIINAFGNAITSNGSASGKSEGTNAKLTINGGSITSTGGAGIYAPQINGVTTITGGTITGLTGVEIRAGTLNISGGTFIATGEYSVKPATSGLTTTGAAVSVSQHTTAQPITLNITGGTFKGEYPISNTNPMHHDPAISDQVVIKVQGGEFSGGDFDDVIDNIPVGYLDIQPSDSDDILIVIPSNSAGYYLHANTSGLINIMGEAPTTSTDYSEINVLSNCRDGYDITMSSTVDDVHLYLDSNSSSSYYLSPITDNSPLSANSDVWGYYMADDGSSAPSGSDSFHPVPTLSAGSVILRTTSETASESDIEDKLRLYFGANLGEGLLSGNYKMIPDASNVTGSIVYQITANPTCTSFPVEISFNKNLDGQGGEEAESLISDFPTSDENRLGINDQGATIITLSSKVPLRDDYLFVEWNTNPSGTGVSYHPGDIVLVGTDTGELYGETTLYAIWTNGCAGATICYDGNGADAGSMENQTATPGLGVALHASNYSRAGYGFAGWNTEADGSGTNYGPNQNIAIAQSGGINLYANWIASAGSLQTWTGADSMNIGDVIALTDNRDGETYAVAKLADGNVWMVENLRLVPSTAIINLLNTNNPTTDFISAARTSSSTIDFCKNNNSDCVDAVSYNTNNINRTLTPSIDTDSNSSSWYSYGVMYNWYTATAGNGTYDMESGTTTGDICPAGWHLPTGDDGEFVALNNIVSGVSNDVNLRVYPNNFIRSGNFDGDNTDGRGKHGRFWSATASEKNKAYRFGYNSSSITPNNTYNKWDAFSIRCIYDGNRIPASEVTVNLGEHVELVTISNSTYGTQQVTTSGDTVLVVNDLPYTISATFEAGYTIDTWTTTSDGQIDGATSVDATYTVSDVATLGVTAKTATQTTYTLNYDTGASSDVIAPDVATSYNASYAFGVTNSIPVVFGSTFIGWSEKSAASSVDYTKDDTIILVNDDPDTISAVTKTLYAVYQVDICLAGNICYYGNGADSGTMSSQVVSGSSATLLAPNYARSGYGFAGWITSESATPYGPNEKINLPDLSASGLKLYAKWVASAGNLQGWNECNTMSVGDVTALTDVRDSNTYLIAKLADNNCWTVENLRLNPSTASMTAQNTNSPANDFATEATASRPSKSLCTSDNPSCYDKLQYSINNLDRTLTQSYDGEGNSSAWYGYGVYYNWYAATAGNGTSSVSGGETSGDICPAGWRLPTGNTNGEYDVLNAAINNNVTNNDTAWRKYPNNFVYSGEYNGGSRKNANSQARVWTATAKDASYVYRLGLKSNEVTARTSAWYKWEGFTVRCLFKNN